MTRNYLDLVVKYASMLILLAGVEDRKAVLGLFNAAYDLLKGSGDPSFPRLGQLIVDYEQPFKKLCDDFVPHSRVRPTRI